MPDLKKKKSCLKQVTNGQHVVSEMNGQNVLEKLPYKIMKSIAFLKIRTGIVVQ